MLRNTVLKLKTEFVSKYGAMALEVLDADDCSLEDIFASINSVPFLAEKKLVIVKNIGTNKQTTDEIEKIIEAAEKGNDLIIVEQKLDKRGIYYKFLKSNTDFNEFNELDETELARWVASEVKNLDASISQSDAFYLVQRVGANQEKLNHELEKLAAYDKTINRDNIDILCEADIQSSIFGLLDSVFSGNLEHTLKLYGEQRFAGVEPLNIFGMIVWQMHAVALVGAAGSKPAEEISAASGISPFVIQKSQRIAAKLGRKKIGEILKNLVKMDKDFKTTATDLDNSLKNFLAAVSKYATS